MTITLYILITVTCLSPVLWCLKRPDGAETAYERRDVESEFYTAQLKALERDKSSFLIDTDEAQAAYTEIARRLLRAQKTALPATRRASWRSIAAVLIVIPSCATALYLVKGEPRYQPHPAALENTAPPPQTQALISGLEARVRTLRPDDPFFVKGNVLLAAVRERQNDFSAALALYRKALDAHFEPVLALHVAELQSQLDHHISAETLALYRRVLAATPPGAPTYIEIQKRIALGEGEAQQGPP